MAQRRCEDVLPTTEVRAKLSRIAAEFDRQGVDAEPVTFGSHRHPQGVIVPWELWRRLLPAIEDQLDLDDVRRRLDEAGAERLSFDEVARALGRDPAQFE